MRARLQRNVERSAPCGFAGARNRLRLSMRTTARLSPAAPHDHAILHHHRADRRIGPGASLPASSQRQRELHEALVGVFRFTGFLRELVFQNAEDHLRNRASRVSSSPESSPRTASKSLASRKLRYTEAKRT